MVIGENPARRRIQRRKILGHAPAGNVAAKDEATAETVATRWRSVYPSKLSAGSM